jgi:phosphonoacetaldehyde hydrolase
VNLGPVNLDRRYRGPLVAAVFDWAGTVVDYGSRAPVLAVTHTFAEFGVPITIDEARGPMGRAKRDHIQAILDLPRVADCWRRVHDRAADSAAVDVLYRAFLQTQTQFLASNSQVIPGCLDAVAWCRERGMRLGSSTGYTRELMAYIVLAAREQGLEFDALVCADDVPAGRPAPWMCLENSRRLDVFPMAALVAVDDTPVGIEAGLNAGMWTIGVAKSGNLVGLGLEEIARLPAAEHQSRILAAHKTLRLAGAHVTVDTVADLPRAIEEIEHAMR